MSLLYRWTPALLSACLVLAAGPARAADEDDNKKATSGEEKKAPPGPMSRPEIDRTVYNTLTDVINRGAAIYNSGDWNGCYRLWEGALLMTRPLLGHRENLQKAITNGLMQAEADPLINRRAWVLRGVLDQVRGEVRGAKTGGKTGGTAGKTSDETRPPARKTLWDRLGGEKGVREIINSLAKRVSEDKKVDFTRGGKFKPTEEKVKNLKDGMVRWISSKTGGPLEYRGEDMRAEHKDMHITKAEFNAFMGDLRGALEDNDVKRQDADALLAIFEKTRGSIVQPAPEKKPDEEKGGDTASVTGKVTSQGKAVYAGNVIFQDAAGKTQKAPLGKDGTYQIRGLKPGEYKIAIDAQKTAAAPLVAKKYADPKTSGITFDAKKGRNNHDIELPAK